jgi:hypothetical protein
VDAECFEKFSDGNQVVGVLDNQPQRWSIVLLYVQSGLLTPLRAAAVV